MTVVTPLRIVATSPLTGMPLDIYTQFVDLDDADLGLDVVLLEPTQALERVAATVVPAPVRPSLRERAAELLRTVRAAAARVTARAGIAARAFELWDRRSRYAARHAVQRRWYGRARSSAETTGVLHRQYQTARALTLSEDDIPKLHAADSVYWIGWAERCVEALQGHDEALHPTTEHRFVCS